MKWWFLFTLLTLILSPIEEESSRNIAIILFDKKAF